MLLLVHSELKFIMRRFLWLMPPCEHIRSVFSHGILSPECHKRWLAGILLFSYVDNCRD